MPASALTPASRSAPTTLAAFASFPLYQRGYTKTVLETIERERGHKEQAKRADAQVGLH